MALKLETDTQVKLDLKSTRIFVLVTFSIFFSFVTPMDYTVHGILQARILEWLALPFCRGSFQPRDRIQVSHMQADSLPAELPGKPT